jgi:hypothetical protein
MKKEKDTIFISHATHEDDYSASWLAAKLRYFGYKVWVDVDDLSAGDSFNTIIKPIIREQAKIFIAITTKSYANKADNQNSGVARELNCATTVDLRELKHNFIFPAKFDDIEYNNFPYTYTGWQSINFEGNWQSGLIDLVKELDKIKFPKSDNIDNPINIWFNAIKVQNKAFEKEEKYYSNWFPFQLPDKIFIHEPTIFKKPELPLLPYSLTLEANRIITFTNKETIEQYISLISSQEFDTSSFFTNDDLVIDDIFTLKEPRKKLIRLLNNTFQNHLSKSNMICWVRGKKKKTKTFYFRINEANSKSVSLRRYGKPRGRRDIIGATNETINGEKTHVNWSFGLVCEANLEPSPHFKIFYTVVFSDSKLMRFEKDIHHTLRKSVPSGWYNRKWFETLLAAMLKISPTPDSTTIQIAIDNNKFMPVENEPFNGISKIGYIEPNDIE